MYVSKKEKKRKRKTHYLCMEYFKILLLNIFLASKGIDYEAKDGENFCRTPDGKRGTCDDLRNCPGLLLDLTHLRESLCFKSLFVPGVCCPITENTLLTTQRPLILTTRPSLFLNPVTTTTTTKRPLVPVFTISSSIATESPNSVASNHPLEVLGNFVDSDECGQQEYSSGRIVGGIEAPR